LFFRVSKNFAFRLTWEAEINAGGIIVILPPHQALIISPSIQFLNTKTPKIPPGRLKDDVLLERYKS
jgi:hypothetical protein